MGFSEQVTADAEQQYAAASVGFPLDSPSSSAAAVTFGEVQAGQLVPDATARAKAAVLAPSLAVQLLRASVALEERFQQDLGERSVPNPPVDIVGDAVEFESVPFSVPDTWHSKAKAPPPWRAKAAAGPGPATVAKARPNPQWFGGIQYYALYAQTEAACANGLSRFPLGVYECRFAVLRQALPQGLLGGSGVWLSKCDSLAEAIDVVFKFQSLPNQQARLTRSQIPHYSPSECAVIFKPE